MTSRWKRLRYRPRAGRNGGEGAAPRSAPQAAAGSADHVSPKRAPVLTALVRFYQRSISPLYPRRCNYFPTCSQYALEALEKYGAWKGGLLALRRLLRCHPFHRGGFDPVP